MIVTAILCDSNTVCHDNYPAFLLFYSMQFVIPSNGIPMWSLFGYGDSSLPYADGWNAESGSFALAASGDSIILYCIENDDSIMHLTALSFSGEWITANSDESSFGTTESALPASLPSNTHLALPHYDNYWYIGTQKGSSSTNLDNLSNPSKWEGSNTVRFQFGDMDTKFLEPASKAMSGWMPVVGTALVAIIVTFCLI